MSDKTVITYKRKRSSSQSDLTKARKVDSSEKTEQEMLPKAELDAFDERFDQVSVMTDIGKEAAAKIEPHEAFSRVRCDAEIVGESQPPCSHGESMGLTTTTDTTKNYITVENEQPDLAQNEIVTGEERGDKVVEERGHENLVKPQSSTPNRAAVLPDENSDGKAKKTEGLVSVDKALQEFSDVERIGVYSGQASYRMASSLRPRPRPVGSSVQNQLDPESRSKGKLPFSNLRCPAHKKHLLTEASDTSYVCADSPDIVGPKISLEDFRNIPSPSSGLNFKNSVHQDDRVREIQWPDFGDTASKSQHQQMFNNAMHAWHSTLSDKPRRILAPWSEPELDFLWIGVRRHGLNNWTAILKDPILCFLRSRVAKDLAEQWSREHKKLLDDAPSQPTRPYSAPVLSPSPFMPRSATHVCYSGNISLPSGLQTERAETTFSPRGLFIHNENTRGSIPVGRTPPVNHHLDSNPARSDYSTTGIRYPRNFEPHDIKNQFETSTLHGGLLETPRHEVQSPPGSSITLPHWLSEALKRNQERLGLADPSTGRSILKNEERIYNPNFENLPAPDHTVASHGNAASTRVDEPWFPERSCMIPVRGMTFQGFSSVDPGWDTNSFDSSAPSTLGMIIGETSKDAVDAGLGPNNALDWNKKSSGSVGPSNLGMIHEDTSSEDTISDDQIGKNQTYKKLV